MNQTADMGIFIATTNGSVGIQRITKEDPDIDSVVCLDGKAMPLPISNAYQDFVRQPTGQFARFGAPVLWQIFNRDDRDISITQGL